MKAKFSSKCPACGGRIAAGSEISKSGGRYVCAACTAGTSTIEIRTSGGTFYRNARGTCEDAPCCGCCTF